MNARYDSLVFMPLIALAGAASKYTLPKLAKNRMYLLTLLIFMACICAMEIWLLEGLE